MMVDTEIPVTVEEKDLDVGGDDDSGGSRKSKRMRHVPPQLLTDYHCGTSIFKRAREGQVYWSPFYDSAETAEKYLRMKLLLKKEWLVLLPPIHHNY